MADLGWTAFQDREEEANIAKYGDPDDPDDFRMRAVSLTAIAKWAIVFLIAILLAVPVDAEAQVQREDSDDGAQP